MSACDKDGSAGKTKKKSAKISGETYIEDARYLAMQSAEVRDYWGRVCEECGSCTVGYSEYDHMKRRNTIRCLRCFKAHSLSQRA